MGVLSFDKLRTADKTEYDVVKVYGEEVRVGSLTAAEILKWVEENDTDRKNAGLRLIVRSVVDEEGNRLPVASHEEWMVVFNNKNPRENGKLVRAILALNGLGKKAEEVQEALKNDSSETATDASPSDSPSPAAE